MAMHKRHLLIAYRFGFALLVTAALATQLHHGSQMSNFDVINFFSFFTIESNLFGAAVFFVGGLALLRRNESQQLDILRGAATLYMVITGLVFTVLLSKIDVQTPLPWVNQVLHVIFPLAIFAEWLIIPPKRAIPFAKSLIWLLIPLVYGVYTLIRGPFAHWYPYPFINVSQHGYAQVALNCVVLAMGMLGLVFTISQIHRFAPTRFTKK